MTNEEKILTRIRFLIEEAKRLNPILLHYILDKLITALREIRNDTHDEE